LFKKVIKIEKFPYNGKVYDLEVNDNETFVAGCGSILVHNTRRESILNPKPFIKEVENGITDFISLLSDIIKVIIDKNKTGHPKYFSPNVDIQLHYTPIREFISDSIRDHLRSMYDRGVLSKQTYTEVIGGCDIDIERKRRVQETQDDYNTIFYPPLIQNREDIPDITDETIENLPEEKTGPEAKNFKGISLEELITPEIASEYIRLRQRDPDDFEKDSFRIIVLSKTKGIKAIIGRLKGKTTTTVQSYLFEKTKWNETEAKNWVEKHKGEIEESLDLYDEGLIYEEAPYKTVEDLPAQVKVLPKDAQRLWLRVFNQSYPKGEDYARRVAWSVVKRIYKKVGDQWTKKSKTKGEDGKMIDLEKASVDDILTNIVQLQKIELQEAQLKVAKKILEEKEGEK
jgi:cation transport regulator ChaB